MDIFPYLLDIALTVAAVYWLVMNIRRPPGSPTVGLFRYHEIVDPTTPEPPENSRPSRYRPAPARTRTPRQRSRQS